MQRAGRMDAIIAAAAVTLLLARGSRATAPHDLSNFQGLYPCASSVRIGRPQSVADVQALVAAAPRVKGFGLGHSWWQQQFCAGDDASAVNIAVADIPNKRIVVDEAARTATVDAGVRTADFLDYLAGYGSGWTLGAFPWFTWATIGGQVATDSHGSSLTYGTLADDTQLLGLQLVLANGTLASFTQADGFLWRAMQASVGRLGVITQLTFRIIPNALVRRTTSGRNVSSLLTHLRQVQDGYRAQGDAAPAVRALDNTCYMWFITREPTAPEALWHVQLEWMTGDMPLPPPTAPLQTLPHGVVSTAAGAAALDAGAMPQAAPPVVQRAAGFTSADVVIWGNGRQYGEMCADAMAPEFASGIFTARNASVHETYAAAQSRTDSFQSDQYELAVPLDRIGDCAAALVQALYGPEQRWRGFRTPLFIRFVKAQRGLVSPVNGGARAYINLEDLVKYVTYGAPNQDITAVFNLLRSDVCRARMHWGKAGWPASNFSGPREYPRTWCDFGCAAAQLDPAGKFAGLSGVWQWNFDAASCCTPQGFNAASCTCR